jgi:hypothetical protein
LVESWNRTARLEDDMVFVSDAWELADVGGTVIHLVAAGEVRLLDGRAEIVALDGAGTVEVTWEPVAPAALTVRNLDDRMLSDVWRERLTRIDITALGPVGSLSLTVREHR